MFLGFRSLPERAEIAPKSARGGFQTQPRKTDAPRTPICSHLVDFWSDVGPPLGARGGGGEIGGSDVGRGPLSHYNLFPTNISYNESIGRYELYVYRMSGMIISYALSYILRPGRIIRTIKSLFSASSSTVVEQRLKDLLRKSLFFQKYVKPFVNRYLPQKNKSS